jgi:hypothetical protein
MNKSPAAQPPEPNVEISMNEASHGFQPLAESPGYA